MKRLALGILLILALAAPSAASASSATIVNPTASPDWLTGHADNVTITMTDCFKDGQSTCKWQAVVGSAPGGCPDDWDSGVFTFWASPKQTTNTSISTGPLSFQLNRSPGSRICVYIERTFTGTGASIGYDVGEAVLEVKTLSLDQAGVAAKSALAEKFAAVFSKGKKRKIDCRRDTDQTADCLVSWAYKTFTYKGDVAVSVDIAGVINTAVTVKKKRHRA